jgi:hypothetical protein
MVELATRNLMIKGSNPAIGTGREKVEAKMNCVYEWTLNRNQTSQFNSNKSTLSLPILVL